MHQRVERETDVHHDTIILISKGEEVKPITLSKIIKFLDGQNPREKNFSMDTLNDLPDLKESREMLDPKRQNPTSVPAAATSDHTGPGGGGESRLKNPLREICTVGSVRGEIPDEPWRT